MTRLSSLEIVFDKAEQAEQQEAATQSLQNEIQELEDQKAVVKGDEKQRIEDLKKTEKQTAR